MKMFMRYKIYKCGSMILTTRSFILVLFILQAISSVAQDDDFRLHSNIGFSYSKNLKNKFNNCALTYRSPKIKDKFHLQADINSYLIIHSPVLGQFNTINLRFDYYWRLNKIHLFPFIGFKFIIDKQQVSSEGQSTSVNYAVAPTIGISGKYLLKRFDISSDLVVTQFQDGNWIELAPKFTYTFWKGLSVNVGTNSILGFTYKKEAKIGFYPFIGINYYLTKKSTAVKQN